MHATEFSTDVLCSQPFAYGVASTGSSSDGGGGNDGYLCYTIEIDPPLGPNETLPIPIPVTPYPPCPTEPEEPDEQCWFDPSLPHCAPVDGECPEGFGRNEDGQCFPHGGCPDGYHSNEDDETGTCYRDSEPCPDGCGGHCSDKLVEHREKQMERGMLETGMSAP